MGEKNLVGDMSFDAVRPGGLNYRPCRYGTSKLTFRGPRRDLQGRYLAFLGANEVYGRFIERPFPDLVEDSLGLTCANFGVADAGPDAFTADPFMPDAVADATVTVVQVMGAHNMNNRFYSVHPRRNDRFTAPTPLLTQIYPDVDFADIHFTKHLVSRLYRTSARRFNAVAAELKRCWVARMKLLLERAGGDTVLLWFSCRPPARALEPGVPPGQEPMLVTEEMLCEAGASATRVLRVIASPRAVAAGTDGMVFAEMQAAAASEMMGPHAHRECADALITTLKDML